MKRLKYFNIPRVDQLTDTLGLFHLLGFIAFLFFLGPLNAQNGIPKEYERHKLDALNYLELEIDNKNLKKPSKSIFTVYFFNDSTLISHYYTYSDRSIADSVYNFKISEIERSVASELLAAFQSLNFNYLIKTSVSDERHLFHHPLSFKIRLVGQFMETSIKFWHIPPEADKNLTKPLLDLRDNFIDLTSKELDFKHSLKPKD